MIASPPPPPPGTTVAVHATVETEPSHHDGDTADDVVFWIHPTDGSQSLVIGDDKDGGLMVWGLDGREVQYLEGTQYNNLDLRYNFPLAGRFSDGTAHQSVALLMVGDETGVAIDFFKVNPATRRLEAAGSLPMANGLVPYGGCMYRSAATGKTYVFITSDPGTIHQYDVRDDGGQVSGTLVREFAVSSTAEGCVADDVLGHLYVGEEDVGIWKFGAEPGAGATRTQVDVTTHGGNLRADVEGLAIYYADATKGYLLASSQGNSTIVLYTREGNNTLVGKFTVEANGTIDGVTGTDGIEAVNLDLGSAFPGGLFVVSDEVNPGANQNFKLVPWPAIAGSASPELLVDSTYDPHGTGCLDATWSYHNGSGTNPAVLVNLQEPVLGSPWEALLDCTGHAPATGHLWGFSRSAARLFPPYGELLIDPTSSRLFALMAPHQGNAIHFTVPIPADLSLCGRTAFVQGLCRGAPGDLLSNAIELRPGR